MQMMHLEGKEIDKEQWESLARVILVAKRFMLARAYFCITNDNDPTSEAVST